MQTNPKTGFNLLLLKLNSSLLHVVLSNAKATQSSKTYKTQKRRVMSLLHSAFQTKSKFLIFCLQASLSDREVSLNCIQNKQTNKTQEKLPKKRKITHVLYVRNTRFSDITRQWYASDKGSFSWPNTAYIALYSNYGCLIPPVLQVRCRILSQFKALFLLLGVPLRGSAWCLHGVCPSFLLLCSSLQPGWSRGSCHCLQECH